MNYVYFKCISYIHLSLKVMSVCFMRYIDLTNCNTLLPAEGVYTIYHVEHKTVCVLSLIHISKHCLILFEFAAVIVCHRKYPC